MGGYVQFLIAMLSWAYGNTVCSNYDLCNIAGRQRFPVNIAPIGGALSYGLKGPWDSRNPCKHSNVIYIAMTKCDF